MAGEGGLLQQVRIASPCSAAWDRMEGDERVRFCRECGKHVYNLTVMDAGEAEALIREKEGRLCVRMYRRRDGTALAGNCPRGLATMRRNLLLQTGLLATLFAAVPGFAMVRRLLGADSTLWQREPWHGWGVRLGIVTDPPMPTVMGAIAALPTAPRSQPRRSK
jgi:hypothetical protein